jgi:hypothetical protein
MNCRATPRTRSRALCFEPIRQFEVTTISVTLSNDNPNAYASPDSEDASLMTMKRFVPGDLRKEIDRVFADVPPSLAGGS